MVEEAYKTAVVAWGMPPGEFWKMCPDEWWWQVDARLPVKKYGDLTEDEVEEIYDLLVAKGTVPK